MHQLFEFELPGPLSPEAYQVLRSQLQMRFYQRVPFYHGLAVPWHNAQILLIEKDPEHYLLVGRSLDMVGEQQLARIKSGVAQIAQQAGSTDPRIQQAIQPHPDPAQA